MPSKNTLSVLIIAVATVTSIWLVKKPESQNKKTAKNPLAENSVKKTYENLAQNSDDSWKGIIANIHSSSPEYESVIKNNDENSFDETSITAQLSRDFMSEYLRLKTSGETITQQDISNLTNKVLSNPLYNTSAGARYLSSNLKIVTSNQNTVNNYKLKVTASLRNGFNQIKEDPSYIVLKALNSQNPSDLAKLDPIIVANKKIISEFLEMTVPENAVKVHLSALNSFSNLLADLESLRVIMDDPIRGFTAIKYYDQHKTDFVNAVNTLSQYILKN